MDLMKSNPNFNTEVLAFSNYLSNI